jgi:hypothetical protein
MKEKGRAGAIGFFWTWAKRQVAHLQEVNGGRYIGFEFWVDVVSIT